MMERLEEPSPSSDEGDLPDRGYRENGGPIGPNDWDGSADVPTWYLLLALFEAFFIFRCYLRPASHLLQCVCELGPTRPR